MTIFVPATGSGTPTGVAGVYDYNSLKQAVQDWFARSDLGNWIDYFIQIAEADIYRDIIAGNQGRGVRPMEAALSVAIANGAAAVPSDYLGLKIALVSLNGNTFELQRVNPEFIYTQYPAQVDSGTPAYIARQGANFVFGPYPDQSYTITGIYWQKARQLTSVNSTNWIVNTIPTIMLAATNRAAARFNKDQEAYGIWDSLYTQQMQSYILTDRAEEMSGSALAMVSA
jgi:hypothetical protein